jgi:hypothetical protein
MNWLGSDQRMTPQLASYLAEWINEEISRGELVFDTSDILSAYQSYLGGAHEDD